MYVDGECVAWYVHFIYGCSNVWLTSPLTFLRRVDVVYVRVCVYILTIKKHHTLTPADPFPYTHSCFKLCLQCHLPDASKASERGEEKSKGGAGACPKLMLVLTRTNPREMTEGFLRAFHKLRAEGLVDRRLAIASL